MIVTLLFAILLQDGPIATAPADAAAQQGADPGPTCTFGGRPVRAEGCPPVQSRATPAAPASPSLQARIEACAQAAGRRPSETEFECASRVRTDAWVRSVEPDGEQAGREAGSACGFGGRPVRAEGCPTPPGRTASDRPVSPAQAEEPADPWDALARAGLPSATPGEAGYSRSAVAARADGVPDWALSDPPRWEASQCGAAGDDACRRQARNRLAMARAGGVAEAPAEGGGGQGCRMVMQRSESGFGGSLSRVCGDEAAADDLVRRLDIPARPAPEPCDRPASLETQETWIARCRALPAR